MHTILLYHITYALKTLDFSKFSATVQKDSVGGTMGALLENVRVYAIHTGGKLFVCVDKKYHIELQERVNKRKDLTGEYTTAPSKPMPCSGVSCKTLYGPSNMEKAIRQAIGKTTAQARPA